MMAYDSDLGTKDVGFAMDRRFCSMANVKYMIDKGLDLIIGVDIVHKTTRKAAEPYALVW
jgi:hypothetical protein